VKLTGRDWGFLALALVVAAVCVRLGLWQVDRLAQRRGRNAAITAQLARPPLEVAGAGAAGDSLQHRRLHARGAYDYTRERLWPGRFHDGAPGVAVLTPLKLADGSAVFVDRGWAPSPDGFHVDLARYRERDSAAVHGLGAVPPRGRGDVDPARLADSLPYRVLPFVIQQLPDGLAPLRRWAEPQRSAGPHLVYAVQWFAFAVIAVVGTAILLTTSRRNVAEKRRGPP
jgi:surfeit locus 1 family protein